MQGQQAQMAKFGAKLNYIKFLRGKCPEGYEMQYFKEGGCMKCKKKEETVRSAQKGDVVSEFRCGRKMKKKACGGDIKKKVKAIKGTKFTNNKVPAQTAQKRTTIVSHDLTIEDDDINNRGVTTHKKQKINGGAPEYYYYTSPDGYGPEHKFKDPKKGAKNFKEAEKKSKRLPDVKTQNVTSRAKGGTLDIFAPYRNLKLRK